MRSPVPAGDKRRRVRLVDPRLEGHLYGRYPLICTEPQFFLDETAMCWGIRTDNGWFYLLDSLCPHLQCETDQRRVPQAVAS